MSPNGGGEPSGDLGDSIKKNFGNFAQFKQMFTVTALEVFGSGWAWLVYDVKAAALKVMGTPNQDTPAMQKDMLPLLGVDVWEHAYYLKHQSKRKDYLNDFFEVINWAEVMERYATATGKGKDEM